MKKLNKVFVLVMAVIMTLAMSASVFAATQEVPATNPDTTDNATITINNPAKGQEYSAFKLFDATVKDGNIAYQGTIPSTMTTYFEALPGGYVQAKPAAFRTVKYYTDATKTTESADPTNFWDGDGMSTGLESALETWATGQTALASGISDGKEALAFTGLPYGYYVITTDHEDQQAAKCIITVDSTNPNASVNDKNINEPDAYKEVEKASYSIGDTIKYKADFDTTNYLKDENGKYWQVIEYTISDTRPNFLEDVKVTKVTIDGTEYKVNGAVPQFSSKAIVIPWATKGADNKYTNDYDNGVVIHIEYEATLTSVVNVNAANINTISIKPRVTDDTEEKPWDEDWHYDAEITTYAAALKKTDGATTFLPGAKFRFAGLKATKTEDGVYTVDSYVAPATAPTSKDDLDDTNSTEMEVNANGKLYIVGLAEDVRPIGFETAAPEGYNLAPEKITLIPKVYTKEIIKKDGYRKYDAKGNIIEESETASAGFEQVTKNLDELDPFAVEVINKPGTPLPATGGIGTTIFYILGSLLVIGCGIVLISRKRMENNK